MESGQLGSSSSARLHAELWARRANLLHSELAYNNPYTETKTNEIRVGKKKPEAPSLV